MEKEEIMINLKVLENLQKDQKIVSRGQYINIEVVSIIPEALRRWHRQDNRNETMKKINFIINSAIEFIKNTEKEINELKTIRGDHFVSTGLDTDKINMLACLEKSLPGVYNLKETYATCTQTCARIDIILNKIRDCLKLYDMASEQIQSEKYMIN
jgi:hypothetical protein